MTHAISWFDLSATDVERAKTFYSTILDKDLPPIEGMEGYYMFPADENGVSGGLGEMSTPTPGKTGALIYLNGGDDLSVVLDRVEGAGGTIDQPKTSIGPHGFIARFIDTEGNLVGLHSNG